MDQEDTLGNGWVLFILLLGNRRFILRLDKKIKNLIFVNNFPFPPSYSSRFISFCGQVYMIYDFLGNIHSNEARIIISRNLLTWNCINLDTKYRVRIYSRFI